MLTQLSERLQGIFSKLGQRGLLTEDDVNAALREVRMALIEADVALPVVKELMATVKENAVGEKTLKAVQPGQQVLKVVHEALIENLGEPAELTLHGRPAVILMAGLQGSGKTTTAGKLALKLKEQGKNVLLASADIYRPAAREQLATLAERVGVAMTPIEDESPAAIAKRALKLAQDDHHDVLIFDTAGRTDLDETLLTELQELHKLLNPSETLLVADSLTGQSAVKTAQAFVDRVAITGVVLTRMDGDARGGAALSLRQVTGVPIKFSGVGEGIEALEVFRPKSLADRILGQGDVISLVEQVQRASQGDEEAQQKFQQKLMSGQPLTMDDLKQQLNFMKKMGSFKGMLGMIPGLGGMGKALQNTNIDEKALVKHNVAIIDSMTKKERRDPSLLNGSRRKRIARGAGVEVSAVNKLVKMHRQMNDMAKMFRGGKVNPAQLMQQMKRMR
jgi:signal recognition particle subunit SRP54